MHCPIPEPKQRRTEWLDIQYVCMSSGPVYSNPPQTQANPPQKSGSALRLGTIYTWPQLSQQLPFFHGSFIFSMFLPWSTDQIISTGVMWGWAHEKCAQWYCLIMQEPWQLSLTWHKLSNQKLHWSFWLLKLVTYCTHYRHKVLITCMYDTSSFFILWIFGWCSCEKKYRNYMDSCVLATGPNWNLWEIWPGTEKYWTLDP